MNSKSPGVIPPLVDLENIQTLLLKLARGIAVNVLAEAVGQ